MSDAIPRKLKTREKLLKAAREHFGARGYDATYPHEIAQDAGVAVGTFYTHFEDKFDIFLQLSESLSEEMLQTLSDASIKHTTLKEEIRALLVLISAAAADNPRLLRVLVADVRMLKATGLPERRRPKRIWIRYWEKQIANWQERELVTNQLDPTLAAYALLGMVREVAELIMPNSGDFGEAVDKLTEMATNLLSYKQYKFAALKDTTGIQETKSPD